MRCKRRQSCHHHGAKFLRGRWFWGKNPWKLVGNLVVLFRSRLLILLICRSRANGSVLKRRKANIYSVCKLKESSSCHRTKNPKFLNLESDGSKQAKHFLKPEHFRIQCIDVNTMCVVFLRCFARRGGIQCGDPFEVGRRILQSDTFGVRCLELKLVIGLVWFHDMLNIDVTYMEKCRSSAPWM